MDFQNARIPEKSVFDPVYDGLFTTVGKLKGRSYILADANRVKLNCRMPPIMMKPTVLSVDSAILSEEG